MKIHKVALSVSITFDTRTKPLNDYLSCLYLGSYQFHFHTTYVYNWIFQKIRWIIFVLDITVKIFKDEAFPTVGMILLK